MAAIHEAIEQENKDAVTELIVSDPSCIETADEVSNRPLHLAVYTSQIDVVKMLLGAGADVNGSGDMQRTPLHYAAIEDEAEIAGILAERGAQLDAIDAHGNTPLYYASQGRLDRSDTAKTLLERGVTVDLNSAVWLLSAQRIRERLKNENVAIANSPQPHRLVGDAAIRGDVDVLSALLDYDAPVNGIPSYRPLVLAFPNPKIVRLLLEHGASPNINDSSGKGVLQKAYELEASVDVIALLEDFGATL
jgi:ankyrin repeat protein